MHLKHFQICRILRKRNCKHCRSNSSYVNSVRDGQPYTDPLLMLPSRLRANSEVSGRCIWRSSWGEEGKPGSSEGAMLIPGNLSQGVSFSFKCTLSKFKAVSHACLWRRSWFCRDHGVQNLWPVAVSSGSESEHSVAPTTLLLEHSHWSALSRKMTLLNPFWSQLNLHSAHVTRSTQDQGWEMELELRAMGAARPNTDVAF